MSVVDWAQVLTGIAAILAVFVALWQARISRDAARDQLRMSREDLKVHLLLQYEDRWEAPTMMALRRALAGRLLDSHVYRASSALPDSTYDVIGDEIPGFFESLAFMHRRRDIDTDAAWAFFDYWAQRYWAALQSFVGTDRARHGADAWADFEGLVRAFRAHSATHGGVRPVDEADLEDFLKQERHVGA